MRNGRNDLREQQGFYQYEDVDISSYKQHVLQTSVNRIEAAGLKPRFNMISSRR